MAKILIGFFLTISVTVHAQNTESKSALSRHQLFTLDDTLISVTNHKDEKPGLAPAIFINGALTNVLHNGGINFEKIADIRIEKDTFEIGDNRYYGKIMIELEKTYQPNFISVSELIRRHTDLTRNPDLLLIDGEPVSCSFNDSYIDAHYILKIDINEIRSASAGDTIRIARLITRTEENVKNANTIYIRGQNDILNSL